LLLLLALLCGRVLRENSDGERERGDECQ